METGQRRHGWQGIALALGLCAAAAVLWSLGNGGTSGADPEPGPRETEAFEPAPTLSGSAPDTPAPEPGGPVPGRREDAATLPPGASGPAPRAPEDGVRFAGVVVDERGRLVPDARVDVRFGRAAFLRPELGADTVRTDDAGAFEIVVAPGERWLVAHAGDAVSIHAIEVDAERGQAFDALRLVVSPTRALEGVVATPRGLPIPGVEVTLDGVAGTPALPVPDAVGAVRTGWQRHVARSDVEGRFTLGRVNTAHVYGWQARHAEWLPATGRVAGDAGRLEVRLQPAATLVGRVLDTSGAPLPGAQVSARSTRRLPVQATCDADGAFELRGLDPERPALLTAFAKAHARHAEVVPPSRDARRARHDLVLEAARSIRGHVEREDGRRADGMHVRLVANRAPLALGPDQRVPFELAIGVASAPVGADGTFVFEQLPSGTYTLSVADPHALGRVVRVQTEAGAQDVRIVLPAPETKGARLDGRVVDADTGKPVKTYALQIARQVNGRWARIETIRAANASGVFWVEHLPREVLKLDVEARGYAAWSGTLEPKGDGFEDVTIRMQRPRRLRLHVRDAAGEDVHGYGVRFETMEGHPLRPTQGSKLLMGAILMLEKGRGVADGLPASRLRVLVDAPIIGGERRTWTFPIDLTEPLEDPLELTLDAR